MTIRVLKVRNAQEAALPLIRLLLDEGKSHTHKDGRVRIVLTQPITLFFAEPTERATAFPVKHPNPFIRLASMLLTHSKVKNEKLLDAYKSDDYWDQLPQFEPLIGFDPEDHYFSMRAELVDREIIADFLSHDFVQLSVMQELMASSYAPKKELGPLAVELTNAYLDATDHLPFIKMLELKDRPADLYRTAKTVPLLAQDRLQWQEEAEIVLRPEAPAFGLREPFMRKVAAPMLATFRHYKARDARWKITIDDIADEAWHASAHTWITQDLEKPDTNPRR